MGFETAAAFVVCAIGVPLRAQLPIQYSVLVLAWCVRPDSPPLCFCASGADVQRVVLLVVPLCVSGRQCACSLTIWSKPSFIRARSRHQPDDGCDSSN
jgi:hypothetical protein